MIEFFFGDLTDELEGYGEGAYITEFVAGGPKNYAYKGINAKGEEFCECKVRGFTLNSVVSEVINFDAIKSQVLKLKAGTPRRKLLCPTPIKYSTKVSALLFQNSCSRGTGRCTISGIFWMILPQGLGGTLSNGGSSGC